MKQEYLMNNLTEKNVLNSIYLLYVILYLRWGSAEILMVCVVSFGRVTTRSCTLSQAELQEKVVFQMRFEFKGENRLACEYCIE
jgi:hypothetical protein